MLGGGSKECTKLGHRKSNNPPKVFISYAHADLPFLEELKKHLAPLERTNMLSTWSDAGIRPGTNWEAKIKREIATSDIVILLVSADYLASVFSEREMLEAVQAAEAKGTRLVPIILSPTLWERTPLARWQVFPAKGRAVTDFRNRDEAWTDIARRIEGLVADLSIRPQLEREHALAAEIFALYEVFKPSGIPTLTFVEPPRFSALKLSLAQPGRGLVVEGPSGIGKTTALNARRRHLPTRVPSETRQLGY
jgi:hypothetical protein